MWSNSVSCFDKIPKGTKFDTKSPVKSWVKGQWLCFNNMAIKVQKLR